LASGGTRAARDVPIETDIDVAHLGARCGNDLAGAPAQPPVSFRSIRRSRFVGRPRSPNPGSGSSLRAAMIPSRRVRLASRSA
jgi:hypothetical protein